MASIEDPLSMSDLIAGTTGRLGTENTIRNDRAAARTTTPVAFFTLLLQGHLFTALWAGNARAYLLRDGNLTQLTRDDVDRHVPGVLTQSTSAGQHLSPNQICAELLPEDRFLLCSGGSFAVLSDIEIGEILEQSETPEAAAQALIQNAIIGGSKNSVSAAAILVSG